MPPHKGAICERYVLYLHVSCVFISFNGPADNDIVRKWHVPPWIITTNSHIIPIINITQHPVPSNQFRNRLNSLTNLRINFLSPDIILALFLQYVLMSSLNCLEWVIRAS